VYAVMMQRVRILMSALNWACAPALFARRRGRAACGRRRRRCGAACVAARPPLWVCAPPSLDEAAQQTAEQNCLFGNRQTDADLLAPLFGQQTPNRTSFCSAPLLTSLVGGPYICQALLIVTAPKQGLMKDLETGRVSIQLKNATVN